MAAFMEAYGTPPQCLFHCPRVQTIGSETAWQMATDWKSPGLETGPASIISTARWLRVAGLFLLSAGVQFASRYLLAVAQRGVKDEYLLICWPIAFFINKCSGLLICLNKDSLILDGIGAGTFQKYQINSNQELFLNRSFV